MEQRKDTNKYDTDDFRLFEKEPPFWHKVIGLGILVLIAISLVAYSTYQVLAISSAFFESQSLNPMLLIAVVLGAVLFLVAVR